MALSSLIYTNNGAPPPGTGSTGSQASSSLSVASVRAALSSFIPQAVIDALGGPNAIQVTQVTIDGKRTIVITSPNVPQEQAEYSNVEIRLSEKTDANGQMILVVESTFELLVPDSMTEGIANFALANGYALIEGKISIIAGQPGMRATPEQVLSALQGTVPQAQPQPAETYNPIVAQPHITSAADVPSAPLSDPTTLYNLLTANGPDGHPAYLSLLPQAVRDEYGAQNIEVRRAGQFIIIEPKTSGRYRFKIVLSEITTEQGTGIKPFQIEFIDTQASFSTGQVALPGQLAPGMGGTLALAEGLRQLALNSGEFSFIYGDNPSHYHNLYDYMRLGMTLTAEGKAQVKAVEEQVQQAVANGSIALTGNRSVDMMQISSYIDAQGLWPSQLEMYSFFTAEPIARQAVGGQTDIWLPLFADPIPQVLSPVSVPQVVAPAPASAHYTVDPQAPIQNFDIQPGQTITIRDAISAHDYTIQTLISGGKTVVIMTVDGYAGGVIPQGTPIGLGSLFVQWQGDRMTLVHQSLMPPLSAAFSSGQSNGPLSISQLVLSTDPDISGAILGRAVEVNYGNYKYSLISDAQGVTVYGESPSGEMIELGSMGGENGRVGPFLAMSDGIFFFPFEIAESGISPYAPTFQSADTTPASAPGDLQMGIPSQPSWTGAYSELTFFGINQHAIKQGGAASWIRVTLDFGIQGSEGNTQFALQEAYTRLKEICRQNGIAAPLIVVEGNTLAVAVPNDFNEASRDALVAAIDTSALAEGMSTVSTGEIPVSVDLGAVVSVELISFNADSSTESLVSLTSASTPSVYDNPLIEFPVENPHGFEVGFGMAVNMDEAWQIAERFNINPVKAVVENGYFTIVLSDGKALDRLQLEKIQVAWEQAQNLGLEPQSVDIHSDSFVLLDAEGQVLDIGEISFAQNGGLPPAMFSSKSPEYIRAMANFDLQALKPELFVVADPTPAATTAPLTVEGLAQAFSGADPLTQLTSLNNSEAAASGHIAPGIERPADMNGNPGALVKISGDKTVVFVGDLHGNVDNLNAILEQYSDGIRSGEVVLVMLGDAIHPETGDITDVTSSIELMDAIVSLRAMYPSSVLFLQGNHDTVSEGAQFLKPGPNGGQVDQGQLFRDALIAERGIEYVEALETFFESCPLSLIVEGANPAMAGHALIIGKDSLPSDMTLEEALINARLNGLALGLTMNQMGLDYDSSDVTWMQQQLGLPENTMFITGHLPDLSQGPVAYLQGNGQPVYIQNGTDGKVVTLMSTGNNVSVIEVTHGTSAEVAVVDVQGSSNLGGGARSADLAAGQVQSAAPDFVFTDPVYVENTNPQPIDIRDIHSPQELMQHLMAGRTIVLYRGESEAGLETGYTFDTVPEEVRAGRMERPSDAALEAYRQANNPNLPSRVSGVFLATSPDDAQFYSERVYRLEIALSPEVIAGIQSGQITALPVGWYDYDSYASAANYADADGSLPEEMMARYFRGPGNGGTSEIVVDPSLVTVKVAGEYTTPALNITSPMVIENAANLEIGTDMMRNITDDYNLAETNGLKPEKVIIRDGSYVISLEGGQEVDHAVLAEIVQNGGSVANYAGLPPLPLFAMPELPAEMREALDAIKALNPNIANLIESQLSTLTPDELAQVDLAKLQEYTSRFELRYVRGQLSLNYYEKREIETMEMLSSMGMSEANVNAVLAEMRWMHLTSAFGAEVVGMLKGKIDNVMDFSYKELHQGIRSNSNDYLSAQLGFTPAEAAMITDIVRARSAVYSAGMLSEIESAVASGQLETAQISHYQAVLDNMIVAGQNVEQAQQLKTQLEALTAGTPIAAPETAATETPAAAPAAPVSIVEVIKNTFDLSDAEVQQLIELISRPGLAESQFMSELVEMGLSLDVNTLKATLNQALMDEITARAAADPVFAETIQTQFNLHAGRIGIGSILSEIGQECGQEYAQGGILGLLRTNSPVVQFLLEPVVEGEFWTSMARGNFGILKEFFGKMMPATSAGILGNSAYNAILNVLGVSSDNALRGLLPQVTVGVFSTLGYSALAGAGTSSSALVRTLSRLLSNPITQMIFVAVALSGPIAHQVSSWMGYENEFAVGATIAQQNHPTAYGVFSAFFGSEWATMLLNNTKDIENYEMQLASQSGQAEATGNNLIDALSALALLYIVKNPPSSNPELYLDHASQQVTPNPEFSNPEYYQNLIDFLSQAMNPQSILSFDPSLFAEVDPLAGGDPSRTVALPDFLGQNAPQLDQAELAYAMLVGIDQGQDLSEQIEIYQALGLMDNDGQPIGSNHYVQEGQQLFNERREDVERVGLITEVEGLLYNGGRDALRMVQNVNQQVDRARAAGLIPGLDVNLPSELLGDSRGVVDSAALMHLIMEQNQEAINEIIAEQEKIEAALGLVVRALSGEEVEIDFSDPTIQSVLNYLTNKVS